MHVLGDKILSLRQKHVSGSNWHSKKSIPSGAVINTDDRNTITAAYNFSESVIPRSYKDSTSSPFFELTSSSEDKTKDRQIKLHFKSMLNSSLKREANYQDTAPLSRSCAKNSKCAVQKRENDDVFQTRILPQKSFGISKENDNSSTNFSVLDQPSSTSDDAFSLSSAPLGFCMVLDEHITV